MSPPHDNGELIRSLVKIPGSGTDRTLSTVLCDLSNVSPYAASINIPRSLPEALTRPLLRSNTPVNDPKSQWETDHLKQKVTQRTAAKPLVIERQNYTRPTQDQPTHPNANHSSERPLKRPRFIVVSQPNRSSNTVHPYIRIINDSASRSSMQVCLQAQHPMQVGNATLVSSSLPQLNQELERLRKENKELDRKLSLFKQLFQDKKRLTSVVQRLGVRIGNELA